MANSSPDQPLAPEDLLLQEIETTLLERLYGRYPSAMALDDPRALVGTSEGGEVEPLFARAVSNLQQAGFITIVEDSPRPGDRSAVIRSEGIRELTRRGRATPAELANEKLRLMEMMVGVARAVQANKTLQIELERRLSHFEEISARIYASVDDTMSRVAEIAKATEESEARLRAIHDVMERNRVDQAQLDEHLARNRDEQQRLDQKVVASEEKVRNLERDFYARMFPLFALVTAAFALVITGAQTATRITETDPTRILLLAGAIMAPATLAGLIVMGVAWWISRPRS